MKPDKIYTGRSTVRMYNCDCMEVIPYGGWNLAIVDPPYGISAGGGDISNSYRKKNNRRVSNDKWEKRKATKSRMNGGGKLSNRAINSDRCNWDEKPPSEEYFITLSSVSENQIIWGGNYFNLPPTRGIVCWDKEQPWENFSAIELAWTSFDNPAKIFRKDNRTVGKIHPTQKPVKLYKWLLTNYANEGDTILDTHGGSMSIAIACWDLGFDLDICELDTDYFNEAVKRFENHIAQKQMEFQ